MSSSLNALSAVVYKNLVYFFFKDTPSEKKAATILKLIVLIMGILCSLLVLIVDQLGEIISIFFALTGLANGPLLGAFTLGMLFPKANSKVCSVSLR